MLTLNWQNVRQGKFTYIWNISITRIHKCIRTNKKCTLFHEQAIYKRGTKISTKSYLFSLVQKAMRVFISVMRWDKVYLLFNKQQCKQHVKELMKKKDIFIVWRTEIKRGEKGFLYFHMTKDSETLAYNRHNPKIQWEDFHIRYYTLILSWNTDWYINNLIILTGSRVV